MKRIFWIVLWILCVGGWGGLCLFGCCDDATVVDQAEDPCGPEPARPGYTVAYQGAYATMSKVDLSKFQDWAYDVQAYARCERGVAKERE